MELTNEVWSKKVSKKLLNITKENIIILLCLVLIVALSIFSEVFITQENLLVILRQISIVGIIACAMTFVIVGGNFDLSVGSIVSLTAVIAIGLHDVVGPALTIVITLILGLVIGSINGYLVGFVKLNSFIVTLGMLSILQAINVIYTTKNMPVITKGDTSWFNKLSSGSLFGLSNTVLIFLVFTIVFGLILKYTKYGRKVRFVGSNKIASEFSAIKSKSIIFSTFILTSFTATIAGILLASRYMKTQTNLGTGLELDVIAAVILGGASLNGGVGSAFKTFMGVLIIGIIDNGLVMVGLPYYIRWIITGVIILITVWVNSSIKKELS